jgi:hypothetical protein
MFGKQFRKILVASQHGDDATEKRFFINADTPCYLPGADVDDGNSGPDPGTMIHFIGDMNQDVDVIIHQMNHWERIYIVPTHTVSIVVSLTIAEDMKHIESTLEEIIRGRCHDEGIVAYSIKSNEPDSIAMPENQTGEKVKLEVD